MGGDYAPTSEIEGALMAVRELNVELVLVGPEARLRQALEQADPNLARAIAVVDAPEVITMDEPVVQAIRRKKKSTIRVGLQLVSDGRADGFVSAGNTGAIMATATMVSDRLRNIARPALAATLPTVVGKPLVLIDVGANAVCKPAHLLQFAMMGDVYARDILGVESPAVGIVSIGEEQLKGTKLTREAFQLLEQSGLRFIGNIEGSAIYAGAADVVVCDGFTGNVILKVSEGTSEMLFKAIKQELMASVSPGMDPNLPRSVFERLMQRFGYEGFGGAPLLGVKDVCVICHGRSTGRAIRNAIKMAVELCQRRVPERIESEMAKLDGARTMLHQGAEA
jgi:glycerol-3-phosphate acyltransferase PlsX